MYCTDIGKEFGLTKYEMLFDEVKSARIERFLRDKTTRIVGWNRDCNTFGEWRFLRLRRGAFILCFYGHGEHEYTERVVAEKWKFFQAYEYGPVQVDRCKPIILREFIAEREEYRAMATAQKGKKCSEGAQMFAVLANDLGDEDAVLADMQDLGLL